MVKNTTTSSLSSAQPATMEEHLSALLDGEAGAFEERRLLDELESDEGLRDKLSSYALIGETMRSGQPSLVAGSDFLAGIHDKIELEDEYHEVQLEEAKNDSNSKSWLRPVGGFALAASVAAIAVIGFQNYQQPDSSLVTASLETTVDVAKDHLSVAEMSAATVVSADKVSNSEDDVVAVNTNQYRQADSRTRLLLKRYVDSHMQHASTASFVPSVRVIAYAD